MSLPILNPHPHSSFQGSCRKSLLPAAQALAGQAVALVAKVAPAAVAAVRAAVTAGAVIKAKVAGTATSNEQVCYTLYRQPGECKLLEQSFESLKKLLARP